VIHFVKRNLRISGEIISRDLAMTNP